MARRRSRKKRKVMRIDDLLVAAKVISESELKNLKARTTATKKLEQLVIEEGLLSEIQLMELLSKEMAIPIVDLYSYSFSQKVLKLVSKKFAQERALIPLSKKDSRLKVAMADPLDYSATTELRLLTGLQIKPVFATRASINLAIAKNFTTDANLEEWMLEEQQVAVPQTGAILSQTEDAPIIKLVNAILENAVDQQASDIHFDPQETELVVRVRVDGELVEERRLPKNIQNPILSRIKIISSLDITENRLPQDGRAKITVGQKRVDLRVSFLPTVFGEKVVIRVLEMSANLKRLRNMNFSTATLNQYERLIQQPHGLLLITGPTGSGKSSTLYASLGELNHPNVNIITVEDPVEYQLVGINQVQVNSQIGLTFAAGLRSILRQDPDIVMLGEIRDTETAEMAVRASMTGHLVLSTLHTNDAIGSVNRLTDMGVDPFLVSTSLSGVVAQRLLRTICLNCKKEVPASQEDQTFLQKHHLSASVLYEGAGCPTCGMTGYKGRMAIHELFVITPEIRTLITQEAEKDELVESARRAKMTSLLEDGLAKAIAGYTTIKEVLRVATSE